MIKTMNKRLVENSKRWDDEAKKLVAEYDFDLDHVYSVAHSPIDVHGAPPVKNCQFCGQKLWYVAIIIGKPKFADAKTGIYRQIGCDCLERVLGENWHHYSTAMSQLKTLKEAAAKEARQKKYAEKYPDFIKWLAVIVTTSLIENKQYNWVNWFIKDMYLILTTGSKIFTPKMEDYLKSLMKDPRYQPAQSTQILKIVTVEVDKVRKLLDLIEQVDGTHIYESHSAFKFVNSVLNYVIKNNGATQAQLDALNKVYASYKKTSDGKVAAQVNLNDISIPY